MTPDELKSRLQAGFDSSASVRVRRPGLIYQIELPAFLADGDAAQIFVRTEAPSGCVTVTDLGQTLMRLSYTRALSDPAVERLERLASAHRFSFQNGQFFRHVPFDELFAAALALAQLETEAELAIRAGAARALTGEQFRSMVLSAIRAVFPREATIGYHEEDQDPAGLFPVDAVVTRPGRPVGIAIIPSDIEAERAVSSKLWLAQHDDLLRNAHWVALPRNLNGLTKGTKARLVGHYATPVVRVEDRLGALDAVVREAVPLQ